MSDGLSSVDKARIDLWTSMDLIFANSVNHQLKTFPRFTSCVKPSYTKRVKGYLEWMEDRGLYRPPSNPKAVCIKLGGQLRYVWRTDVLTEKEYEDAKRKDRESTVGVFGSKSKRSVGEGDKD